MRSIIASTFVDARQHPQSVRISTAISRTFARDRPTMSDRSSAIAPIVRTTRTDDALAPSASKVGTPMAARLTRGSTHVIGSAGFMAVDVLTEVVVARFRDAPAAFASNPDNAPSWYVNIRSIEWKSKPSLHVGARVAVVARFLGRRMAHTYEIAEYVPSERVVMRTTEGRFPMETIHTWETTDEGGTRMTLRNRGEPTGFSRLAAPFVSVAMRNANTRDLSRLKALLEREPHVDTSET